MARGPFVIYADESGDTGLENFDEAYPVFVLCCAVYRISEYLANDLPGLSNVKFKHWWHDAVVLHSHKIRKRVHPFQALKDDRKRALFIRELSTFFSTSKATLIAAAIDKPRHRAQYVTPAHPYDMALQFCLERVYGHIHGGLKPGEAVTFVFEKRGCADDKLLAEKFEHFCRPENNQWNVQFPFRACFAGKEENIAGLQIADLAAYPIARYVETRNDNRPDWQAIKPRIRSGPKGIEGWGLKIFP